VCLGRFTVVAGTRPQRDAMRAKSIISKGVPSVLDALRIALQRLR
jgi:hypothetical protein